MIYINVKTQEYPLKAWDIRRQLPNVSFPSDNAGFEAALPYHGYAIVNEKPRPIVEHTKTVTEGAPLQTDAGYVQNWIVSDATADEIADRTADAASAIRYERNQLLSACDWTQLPDAPADAAAWATYRQALRDISSQAGFPWNVIWPTEP